MVFQLVGKKSGVGARENFESISLVVQGFAGRSTWTQAELARHVGIEARALRRLLLSLSKAGMPLERDEEHPHVYWSVPKQWFPGGVFFDEQDWEVLVHAVLRITDEQRRTRLMSRLLSGRKLVATEGANRLNKGVVGTLLTNDEQKTVLLIERSFLENQPLEVRYYSGSSGQLRDRIISPQRLVSEPRGRLVAFCHENRELRWFRIDNIARAQLASAHVRQDVPQSDIDIYVASSVDGFQDGSQFESAFRVEGAEANWVRSNLLPGMRIDTDSAKTLRVVSQGGAVVVARFIAGLGGAAVAEGAALRALVRDVAAATLEAHADQ